ncbi:LacI family DNA-binding transcriptional regulator [Brachybacterium sp. UMB0905]|uniref:LacI family DNA-binding transcriptional regulator n=1 Tax=Brachybacterium sp. UMB0905 TaxID=2069310 RepID=UPI00130444C5|nr:LacI family DNA-binding transcriptional regulator [Brachybacterium sp. UMB0905]
MSSLREVAAAAGVSRMTVSNVINGRHRKVSQATIDKVRAAIDELHYVPDAPARSLAANGSRMIGLVVHHPDERRSLLENPHDAILVGAVERAATAAGFSFITDSSADVVATARALGSWRTDGLIVYGSVADEVNELQRTQPRPLVFIDNYSSDAQVTGVGVDDEGGGQLAGEHLLGLRHRQIAFAGPLGSARGVVARRLAGLRDAVDAAAGAALGPLLDADHEPGSAARVVEQLLAAPEQPTAVVAASDVLAAEMVGALLDRGVAVPGQVSLLGFDGVAAGRWIRPQLTTISQDIEAKAAAAVELLTRLIDRDPTAEVEPPPRQPMQLVVRDSTGPAGAGPAGR